jgi:hypothetical protein
MEKDGMYVFEKRYVLETLGSNFNIIKDRYNFPDIDFKYTYFDNISVNYIVFGKVFNKFAINVELQNAVKDVHENLFTGVCNMMEEGKISRASKSKNVLHNAGSSMPYQQIVENFCAGQIYNRGFTDSLIAGSLPYLCSNATKLYINMPKLARFFGI